MQKTQAETTWPKCHRIETTRILYNTMPHFLRMSFSQADKWYIILEPGKKVQTILSRLILEAQTLPFKNLTDAILASLSILRYSRLRQRWWQNTPFFHVLQWLFFFSSPEPLGSQGKLIVNPSSRRPSVRRTSSVVHYFQRSSSLKPLDQSKPNFIWSLLGKGERKLIKMVQVT